MNAKRSLPASLSALCIAVALIILSVPVSSQELDDLAVDLPNPLGSRSLVRPTLSNDVEQAELSLDSGFRALLPRHRGPLVHGALPLAGGPVKQSEYDALKVKAAKLLLAGRHQEAQVIIRQLRRQRLADPDVRCLYATSCFYQKRFGEADMELKRLLAGEPTHPTGLFLQLCVQHMQEENPTPAFDWSQSALIQTEMFVVWLDHSRAHLLRILNPAQFATICATAIGNGTEDKLGGLRDSLAKARTAYTKRDYNNALIFYDIARTHGLRSEALFLRTAECLFFLNRHDDALKRLEAMCREFGHNPHVWYNRGLVLMNLSRFDQAETVFIKAQELDPRNGLFAFARVCAMSAQQRIDEAWPLLEKIAAQHPVKLRDWIEGPAFYLADLRADSRFRKLPKAPELEKTDKNDATR